MEDLYEILEVSRNASNEVIEKAYKVLVKRYHPDVSLNKESAEKMMKKINNAYAVLSDTNKRKEYDYTLYQFEDVNKSNAVKSENIDYKENEYNINENYQTNSKVIDNRILFVLIIVAIILFAISCISIFNTIGGIMGDNEDFNNTGSSASYITDPTCNLVVENIAVGFENFDMDMIINNISNKEYFKDIDINIVQENIDIYKSILLKLDIKVNSIKAINDKAQIQVEITRNNVEDILVQYFFDRAFTFNTLTAKQEKELLIKSIADNTKEVNVNNTFNALKVDNEWKIQLNNNDILNLLGMNISKYVDIFELIN